MTSKSSGVVIDDTGSFPLNAALGSLIMGFGMGLLSVSSTVLIQETFEYSERGSVAAPSDFSAIWAVISERPNWAQTVTIAWRETDQLRTVKSATRDGCR